ncbi:MAG: maleylpyruvate isomerase family mycothiol-dependent enzyme, partial [Pseudomonadales bacterium]|nr:maleylpyruvate isomerase family mycothiol-dependent enzyme [Pseudomonadales bacterium]
LSKIESDDWARITPFKEYSVYDVVAHLHTTDHAATVALEQPDEFRRMVRERDPAIGITSSGAQLPDLIRGEALREKWREDLDGLCDLLGDVDLKLRVPWFGPDMSVRMFASARQMETWSHGQDIYDLMRAPRTHTDRLKNIAQIGVRTFGWTFANRSLDVPEPPPYV